MPISVKLKDDEKTLGGQRNTPKKIETSKPDFYNHRERLARLIERVETGKKYTRNRKTVKINISEHNRRRILEYHNYCLSNGLSISRVIKFMQYLLQWGEWLKKNFDDVQKEDIERVLKDIELSTYAEWTKNDYKTVIKRFFQWLREPYREERQTKGGKYPPEVSWIKTKAQSNNNKLPEDMLTEQEILKLINACDNFRDKALVSFLWESGCRVGELLPLKIHHVKIEKDNEHVILPSGKTGARRVRIVSSIPHLALWTQQHPLKDKPDAPLWIGLGTTNREKPLDYPSVRKLLQSTAKKAGIQKHINPHNFRHSRATFLSRHLTEAQMKQYLGWTQGSDMAAVYVHLAGRDTDSAIEKIHGIKKPEEEEESILAPVKCQRCDFLNQPQLKYCGKCGSALSLKAVYEIEDAAKGMMKLMDTETKQGIQASVLTANEEKLKLFLKLMEMPERKLEHLARIAEGVK
jgi:integrase